MVGCCGATAISTSIQLHVILDTDSKDMLVLSSTVVSCYYNCCTDGSTSPINYGYPSYMHAVSNSYVIRGLNIHHVIFITSEKYKIQLDIVTLNYYLMVLPAISLNINILILCTKI
jgi:hypothetical protein